jgi:pimeloyl-ACP methyl ester carboxylesterase
MAAALVSGCASPTVLTREADSATLAPFLADRLALVTSMTHVPTTIDDRTISLAVHETTLASPQSLADSPSTEPVAQHLREARAEPSRVIILVHGMLADARSFRFLEPELARIDGGSRLLLVDLPACGESENPSPAQFPDADACTDALAGRVLQAIAPSISALSPGTPITIVGHSLGGAVVLRMMCNPALRAQHNAALSRVDSIVLLAPLDVAVPTPPSSVVRFVETPDWQFTLGTMTGTIRSRVEAETRHHAGTEDLALAEEAQIRLEYIERPERRRAMKQMFLGATPLTSDRRPDWDAIDAREADYARLDDAGPVPVLIIHGQRDEITPVAMAYKLDAQIPDSTLVVLPGVKHSPHIERTGTTAALIKRFLAGERDSLRSVGP